MYHHPVPTIPPVVSPINGGWIVLDRSRAIRTEAFIVDHFRPCSRAGTKDALNDSHQLFAYNLHPHVSISELLLLFSFSDIHYSAKEWP